MTIRPLDLAVLGATGAVGQALLQAIDELELPVASMKLLASERGAGETIDFRDDEYRVEPLREGVFQGLDLAFFAASAEVSKARLSEAKTAGCLVVDLTPAFRGLAEVPLVLPEVNRESLAQAVAKGVVALPGPAAAQLAMVLAPLHRAVGVERVVVTTFESVSGAGRHAVRELEAELRALLAFQEPPAPTHLPHRIAFNLVPQSGPFGDDGTSEGERGLVAEVRRLLGSSLRIAATTVRVPIFYGHSQAVNVKTRRPLGPDEARELLRKAAGVKVIDAPREGVYPMPMLAVSDDAVLVGRIRPDGSQENGLDLFISGDNLRRAAATAAVQVARGLLERRLGGGPATSSLH